MAKREDTSWQRDPALWPAHVTSYTHPRAIEAAARKHGDALGYAFLALLAHRLREVDVVDGAVLSPATAWGRVEGWWRAGQVAAAVGARRARAA